MPHAWESGLIFEETTKTLFSGDLFTQLGDGQPALTRQSILAAAIAAEEGFHATALTPLTAPTIRALKMRGPFDAVPRELTAAIGGSSLVAGLDFAVLSYTSFWLRL